MSKLTFLIAFLIATVLLNSCCGEREMDEIVEETESIWNGTWHLTNVSGGLLVVNQNFEMGEVMWTFDEENNQLTINRTIDDGDPSLVYTLLGSGTYIINVTTDTLMNSSLVIIDEDVVFNMGQMTFEGENTLIFNEFVPVDGFAYRFER